MHRRTLSHTHTQSHAKVLTPLRVCSCDTHSDSELIPIDLLSLPRERQRPSYRPRNKTSSHIALLKRRRTSVQFSSVQLCSPIWGGGGGIKQNSNKWRLVITLWYYLGPATIFFFSIFSFFPTFDRQQLKYQAFFFLPKQKMNMPLLNSLVTSSTC